MTVCDNIIQCTTTVSNSYNHQNTNLNIDPELEPLSWKFWKKKRYILVIMSFLGLCNLYALRVNMSIAIVAMTKIHIIDNDNGTIIEKQDFNWNSKEKGLVLSSFFYGYIITQIPAGYLCTKYSSTMIFSVGILFTSIFTILTPIGATFGIWIVIVIRVIEGLFEGAIFPALNGMWAKWAPPNERSRMNSIAFSGNYFGTLVAMPICSKLADTIGWESIFYVFGALGILWYIIWFWIIQDTPANDKTITKDECRYIQQTIGLSATDKRNIPWKSILTSIPVWAIVAAHFTENWGVYTMITQLPTFLTDTLGYSLQMAGTLSGIPYFGMFILLPLTGCLSDYLTTREIMTKTQTRKYATCFSYLCQTIFLLATAWLMDPIGSIVCIIIGSSLGAFAYSGFFTNLVDIAPQYGCVITGFSNTIATIPGIVSPTLTGFIVQNAAPSEWQTIFYIDAAIFIICGVIYWIWCSAEVQPWAVVVKDETEISNNHKITNKPNDH